MNKVDIVIPVLNEEHSLPRCIENLQSRIDQDLKDYDCSIVVADNGSTDRTLQVANSLREHNPSMQLIHLDVRGRGLALKTAGTASEADILAYMDVDLSTDLGTLRPLLDAIAIERFDIAIGTRLAVGAHTTRSMKREFVSRAYNKLIRMSMGTSFTDAQCGFKAVSRYTARKLVPTVVNNHWFFDTELLVIGEKNGFSIKELPVTWYEDPDSRVRIAKTAVEDIKGLARLKVRGVPRISPPLISRDESPTE